MKFLFLIFLFFVLFVFLFGFSILRLFAKAIFGSRPKQHTSTRQTRQGNASSQTRQETNPPVNKQKIFTPDEGEYVDYEEVKDPNG